MQKIHTPKKKVIIASSIEGVFNNGVRECGFVSLNAHARIYSAGKTQIRPFFRSMQMDEFIKRKEISESDVMKAFLALRPLVKVAEDYLTVLQAIRKNPRMAERLIESRDRETVAFFESEFRILKENTSDVRSAFKEEFYKERKRCKEEDVQKWQLLQAPFTETIEQFRILNKAGYILSFVTSKDEQSTFDLCEAYSSPMAGYLKEEEVRPVESIDVSLMGTGCMITRERIVGLERIGKENKKDKAYQMSVIAEIEGVSKEQVIRLDDMYNSDEVQSLRDAGFDNMILQKGGYAFDFEYEQAAKEGIVIVERKSLAQAVSEMAEKAGF